MLSGATGTVEVTVQVPAGLAPGTVGAVDVEVRSALDPANITTVRAQVVIRTAPPVVVGGVPVETSMGATVQVPLDARDVENLYGAGCRVTYDDKALQFVERREGRISSAPKRCSSRITTPQARSASRRRSEATAQPVSGNGTIAVLTFRALEAGTTQLDIDELQLLGGDGGRQELAGKARSIPVRCHRRTTPDGSCPSRRLADHEGRQLRRRAGCAAGHCRGTHADPDTGSRRISCWNSRLGCRQPDVSISLDGTELKLVIGKSSALVNGKSTPVDSTRPKGRAPDPEQSYDAPPALRRREPGRRRAVGRLDSDDHHHVP